MKRLFVWLNYFAKRILSSCPLLFYNLFKILRYNDTRIVSKSTELVIEGYPRSGNTYAIAAFQFSQSRTINVASHVHMIIQLKLGIKWNIPTIVIVREPIDAIISFIIREDVSPRFAIFYYKNYYEYVKEILSKIVVIRFSELVNDFNILIKKVNQRYKTNYKGLVNTVENNNEIFKVVKEMDKIDRGKKNVDSNTVAIPNDNRLKIKRKIEATLLNNPTYLNLINDCNKLFKEINSLL